MAALREILAFFQIKVDDKELKKGVKTLGEGIKQVKAFGAALSDALFVREISSFVRETVEMADTMGKTATQLGLSVEAFGSLSFAATQAGVDTLAFSNALKQLQNNAVQVAERGGELSSVFQKLGIEVRNTNGEIKTGDELIMDFAEGISQVENSSERTHAAMRLLGETGSRLLPLFENGAEGVQQLRDEFEAYGGGLSMIVESSEELKDTMGRLNLVFLGFRARILSRVLPTLNWLLEMYTKAQKVTIKWIDQSNILEVGLVALGAVAIAVAGKMVIAWAATLWPLALLVAALAIVIIAVDDVYTAFQDGDSVTSDFFNAIMEAGNSTYRWNNFLVDTKKGLVGVTELVKILIKDLKALYDAIFKVGEIDLSKLSGTGRNIARGARSFKNFLMGAGFQSDLDTEQELSVGRDQETAGVLEGLAMFEQALGARQQMPGLSAEARESARQRQALVQSMSSVVGGQEPGGFGRTEPVLIAGPGAGMGEEATPITINNTFTPTYRITGMSQEEIIQATERVVARNREQELRDIDASIPETMRR